MVNGSQKIEDLALDKAVCFILIIITSKVSVLSVYVKTYCRKPIVEIMSCLIRFELKINFQTHSMGREKGFDKQRAFLVRSTKAERLLKREDVLKRIFKKYDGVTT